MQKEFKKQYDPKAVEEKIYNLWQQNAYFGQKTDETKENFSVIMPPPNVTGKLHMGHALDNTLQDILVRFKRMTGFNVLWVPGLDHAAISTEVKVTNMLREQGINKADLTREEFLEYAYKWKEKYGNIIINQVKKLGVSCNWEKLKFTMDDPCSKAVKKVFVDLYNEGLIYKGNRIVNYCPNCKTSLSDIEVDFTERPGNLWYIKYYLKDSVNDYITVATTRPETLLGDVAVAVNPKDERYKNYIGKQLKVPLTNRFVPVIADDFVEIEYGTGAVKITPAHDINDFDVGVRHNLGAINLISKEGLMLEPAGKYSGLDVKDARKAIVKDLESKGDILKTENITHNVGSCYRCHTFVEPLISEQWFLKTKELAKEAINCVNTDALCFIPERFTKTYLSWMLNIKDWCISRQIWWGHRIPVYYCKNCRNTMVSAAAAKICPHCNSSNIEQDNDTLDTWFSSGLWPFSVFDWPKANKDFKAFYPTSVLVTGYDIIFFWVARMVMLSLKFTGKVPFKDVLIHGLVRDSLGRKMSKSLGNGIDPIDIIDEFGADALRFMLVIGSTLGNDIRFSKEKLTSSRNFINKLYNAARYIYLKTEDILEFSSFEPDFKNLQIEDKWILLKLGTIISEVKGNLEKFEFGIALAKLYDFVWDVFCDWYIELSKIRLTNKLTREDVKNVTKRTLIYVFFNILKLLHPFVPFITENLWQIFTSGKFGYLMFNKFPEKLNLPEFNKETKALDDVIEIIKAIRRKRTELRIDASKILSVIFIDYPSKDLIKDKLLFIQKLARVNEIKINYNFLNNDINKMSVIITNNSKIYINNNELLKKEEDFLKLNKELKKAEQELLKVNSQLNNQNFLAKAPNAVVAKLKESKVSLERKIEKFREIEKLQSSMF